MKYTKVIKAQETTIVNALKSALADEYLAAYQYLAPIGLAVGDERVNVEDEFQKHYEEELEHAEKLKKRIIQLDATPLMSPEEWYEKTSCGYTTPIDYNTITLVEENLDSELKAIEVYNHLVKLCQEQNDVVTLDIVKEILADEIEHAQDLKDFKWDFAKNSKPIVAKIVKKDNKYQVQSEKGRNLGTYDTKEEAEKRLKQVEYFKHTKK